MKKTFSYILIFLCIPLAVILGATVFREKQYAFVTVAVSLLSCAAFFVSFENRKQNNTTRLMLISVMIALCVCGRLLFAALPGFKPVTAMVIIAGMYFGCEAGFFTGSMTALISNFYFGQGAWTPFQMFTWGIIGFAAGLFAKALKKNMIVLSGYGVLSGVLYSLLLDTLTTLWADGTFNLSRYLVFVGTALPVTAEYAVSNVIFLLLLTKPIGEKINRIIIKYGI